MSEMEKMTSEEISVPLLKNVSAETGRDVTWSNDTMESEYRCRDMYAGEMVRLDHLYPDGFCAARSDPVSCWPPTPPNTTAVIKCFKEFNGLRYDDSYNATKYCLATGNWSNSNYSSCTPIMHETDDNIIATSTIYFLGYSLSLLALAIAIGIFLYFKDLRCLRNTIHTNLMCSYMCVYFMWILTLILEINFESKIVCIILVILLNYFNLATFFWMFVEGLYLYILVVKTLTRENFKIKIYIIIGWGIPVIIVIIWAIVKILISHDDIPLNMEDDSMDSNTLSRHCPYMQLHPVDWIYQSPIVLVLALNLLFLVAIMRVLITKLRSANTLETQQSRKMAKALLVLIPLLGVTYIVTISEPTTDPATRSIFEYIRAVLLSTQGLTVALFYCFLNTEVQNNVRHHWETWLTSRSLDRNRLRSGSRSKDWSPRSRTESIRLYSHPAYQKRESCTSEVTTTTMVTTNGNRLSNGGGGGGGSLGGSAGSGGSSSVRSPFLCPPRPSYPNCGNV